MAVVWTQQYRPINSVETRDGDGLSTRAVRDHARNANVFNGTVAPRLALMAGEYPAVEHGAAGTAETLLWQAWIPAHIMFDTYQIKFWAYNKSAAVDGIVRFRCDEVPYVGPALISTGSFTDNMQVVSVTVTGDTLAGAAWYEAEIPIVRSRAHMSWLSMTYENPVGGSPLFWGATSVWHKPVVT